MGDTYAVTVDTIAAELPALFPAGFSSSSTPSSGVVSSWIGAADVVATLHVQRAASQVPAIDDQAAPLAQRYVVAWTKAQVMRAVYAGNDPQRVEQAASGYDAEAKALLAEIDTLGQQMTGAGQTVNRVKGNNLADARDLLLDDRDLGGLAPATPRARRF